MTDKETEQVKRQSMKSQEAKREKGETSGQIPDARAEENTSHEPQIIGESRALKNHSPGLIFQGISWVVSTRARGLIRLHAK